MGFRQNQTDVRLSRMRRESLRLGRFLACVFPRFRWRLHAQAQSACKGSSPPRPCCGRNGAGPRIQTLRKPFFRRIVVIVAVVTPRSVSKRAVSPLIRSSMSGAFSHSFIYAREERTLALTLVVETRTPA